MNPLFRKVYAPPRFSGVLPHFKGSLKMHLTKRAHSRQMGFCAFFRHFPASGLYSPQAESASRPKSTNAHRWDCRKGPFQKLIFEKLDSNIEKRLIFYVSNNILAIFEPFLSMLWEFFVKIFQTRGFSTVSLGAKR